MAKKQSIFTCTSWMRHEQDRSKRGRTSRLAGACEHLDCNTTREMLTDSRIRIDRELKQSKALGAKVPSKPSSGGEAGAVKFVAVVVPVSWAASLLLWLYPYRGPRENGPAQVVPNSPLKPDLLSPPPLTSSACRASAFHSLLLPLKRKSKSRHRRSNHQMRTAPANPRATRPAAGTHPST
jgi:hypothetical protein